MGVDNLTIHFDNPKRVYYAGNLISGTVNFKTTKSLKSEGVFVVVTGRSKVQWTGGQTGRGMHSNYETYLDRKICIHSPPEKQLHLGYHSFSFALRLPARLPSSFSSTIGKIIYKIKTSVHRCGLHSSSSVVCPISIVGIKDLNVLPNLQDPCEIERKKQFGVFFVNSVPLTARISVNKQAFVSGETILLSGDINNPSHVKIEECLVRFTKTVKYFAGGTTVKEKATVFKCKQPGLDKGTSVNWENVSVPVPSLPPSDLDGCNIISIHYKLIVILVPHGIHDAIEFTFPITIGTIPFGTQLDRFQALQESLYSLPRSERIAVNLPPPYILSESASSSRIEPPVRASDLNSTAVLSFSVEPPPYNDGSEQTSVLDFDDEPRELPSYDSLFGQLPDNIDEDETETFQPMHPTFNIAPQ